MKDNIFQITSFALIVIILVLTLLHKADETTNYNSYIDMHHIRVSVEADDPATPWIDNDVYRYAYGDIAFVGVVLLGIAIAVVRILHWKDDFTFQLRAKMLTFAYGLLAIGLIALAVLIFPNREPGGGFLLIDMGSLQPIYIVSIPILLLTWELIQAIRAHRNIPSINLILALFTVAVAWFVGTREIYWFIAFLCYALYMVIGSALVIDGNNQ